MISPSHTAKIRAKISDLHTLPIEAYNPNGYESLKTPGTSHIVTADASGLALSLTSSVNTWLGSQVMVQETGVIMNNDMNDFSIPGVSNVFGYMPSPANFIKPGKRALSSNAPTLIEFLSNNTFCYALGAGGGSHIITGIIQGIWNLLDRDMSPLPALLEPRFHDQLEPNTVALDYRFNNATAAYLTERGHKVSWERRSSDLYVLKRSSNGVFEAVGEPGRKSAAGYAV
jgi:gamma-glutamyltranspeptidase / glutathione hydrolase